MNTIPVPTYVLHHLLDVLQFHQQYSGACPIHTNTAILRLLALLAAEQKGDEK